MKYLIGIVSIFLTCSLFAAPTMVKIDFVSPGSGINFELFEKIRKIVEIEKKYDNVTAVSSYSWGLEGEKTLCLSFGNLTVMERVKEILDVLADSSMTVSFAHSCESPGPVLACTKKLNHWKNPSHCQCPEYKSYHPELGTCENSYLSGVIHYDEVFTMISYDGYKKTELQFPEELVEVAHRFAERGLPSGVNGFYKVVKTVNLEPKVVMQVERLHIEE